MFHLLVSEMVCTIHLNNQFLFQTHKIHDIITDNVLTFELYSQLTSTQLLP